MNKVLLFNPRSARVKPRIPNSILSVAASLEGRFDYVIVDGNLEQDPWETIRTYLAAGGFRYFGCTCMPGPQLKQAIPVSKAIRMHFPQIRIIWGGYFASNQPKVVLESGFVDFIVHGPGDKCFPALLAALDAGTSFAQIGNLIYLSAGKIMKTAKEDLYDQDALPALPYEKLHQFYPMRKYLGPSCLGSRTIAYHSSVGCPFTCSFCAVVPIYNARWRGKSADRILQISSTSKTDSVATP